MAREVESGFHWIQECGSDLSAMVEPLDDSPDWYEPGHDVHIGQSASVLQDDQPLLFDTLSPANTEQILAALEEVLTDDLDRLVDAAARIESEYPVPE